MTYPDCTRLYPHDGPHAGKSILAAGRNTEFERLFTRNALRDIEEYAREHRVHIENLPTTAVCEQAVVDLLG